MSAWYIQVGVGIVLALWTALLTVLMYLLNERHQELARRVDHAAQRQDTYVKREEWLLMHDQMNKVLTNIQDSLRDIARDVKGKVDK